MDGSCNNREERRLLELLATVYQVLLGIAFPRVAARTVGNENRLSVPPWQVRLTGTRYYVRVLIIQLITN